MSEQALVETEAMRELVGRLRTAVGLLERITKYAREDRAVTPGSTRLLRVLGEAAAFLGEDEP